MQKKNLQQQNSGKDKIVGRPIRLNKFSLAVNNKGYAPLLLFGDLHFGHPQCHIQKARAMLDWCLKEKVAVLLMGDLPSNKVSIMW